MSQQEKKYQHLTTSIAICLGMLGTSIQSVHAEGSRSLYPSSATGNRANIEWRNSNYAGGILRRRTLLKVYANAGEYILLGSSAVGVTSGDISVYNPNTVTGLIGQETIPVSANFSCATQRTTTSNTNQGRITTRTIELAGPDTITNTINATPGLAVTNGYVPCFYLAPSTGIYNVVFYGPTGDNSDSETGPTGSIANLQNDTTQNTSVAAWDVTVRSSLTSTTDINGRLFTDYIALFTGANNRPVNSRLFIVTRDGFRYLTDLKGLDPNGFALLANNIGFFDSDGQTPLYRNLVDGSNDQVTAPQGGVTLARPSHLIFFTNTNNITYQPDSSAIAANGIILIPVAPILSAFTYTGSAGGINSFVNSGGTFSITANVSSTYEIIISRDGIDFDPTNVNNRVLRGVRSAGNFNVNWNGLDNSGVAFPVGTYSSRAKIQAGEYHFPLIDVENSPSGGPTYTLVNAPDGTCAAMPFGCSTAYYDDRGYRTLSGINVGTVNITLPTGTPSSPSSAVLGFNSDTSTQRSFSNNFGDKRALDLWTFFPSATQTASLNIVADTPSILLVKRITAINNVDVTGFIADAGTADPKWPDSAPDPNVNAFLRGAIACPSTGSVICSAPQPTQTIEYTVYFLSNGAADATNVTICDLVPANTTFVSGAYGSNRDIAFLNSAPLQTTPSVFLTGLPDSDIGNFYQPNVLPPTTCRQPITNATLTASDNTNGLVVVDVVRRITTIPLPPTEFLPFATGAGTPARSYGFVRFTVNVN